MITIVNAYSFWEELCPKAKVELNFSIEKGYDCKTDFPGSTEVDFLFKLAKPAPVSVKDTVCAVNVCPGGDFGRTLVWPYESMDQPGVKEFLDINKPYYETVNPKKASDNSVFDDNTVD